MMIDDKESTTTAVGILEAGNGQVWSLAKLYSFHVYCFQGFLLFFSVRGVENSNFKK